MNHRTSEMLPAPETLIVIGASTGGTRVLNDLAGLLLPLRACVVIVQHMPKFINASVVRSLGSAGRMPVKLAEHGEKLREGWILVAPSEVHCRFVFNNEIRLAAGPKVNYVCPSIDITMMSLVEPPPGQRLIGVILTGMGRDGAAGLAHMKQLGGLTVAQDEASCAVYGMPAEAVRLGCVDQVLTPDRIARLLARETGADSLSHRATARLQSAAGSLSRSSRTRT